MKIEKLSGKLSSIGAALQAGLFMLRIGKSVVREIKGRKAKPKAETVTEPQSPSLSIEENDNG